MSNIFTHCQLMETTYGGITPDNQIPESIINVETLHKGPFRKFAHWFSKLPTLKKIILISLFFLIILLIISAGIYGFIVFKGYQKNASLGNGKISINGTPTMTPTPITKIDPLTGVKYSGSDINNLNRPPLAVMIENSIPARPQTGINQSDIMYETLAEGGITRFMAVFLGQTPPIVGPIRSARTYFLSWVSEYNAIYTHWGENSDVAPSLPADNIRNLDALVQGGTDQSCINAQGMFCRDLNRGAPHNGYGFPSKIWNYGSSQGWSSASALTPWTFKADATLANRGIDQSYISVSFMPYDYDYSVKWVYDKNANQYTRYDNNNQIQLDKADNSAITAKNLIMQFVNGDLYTSSGGKEVWEYTDTGSGKASMFIDGKEIDGTWKKDSLTSRTQFYDQAGSPVSFDQGRSWISVLVNNTGSFTASN